MRAYWSRKIRPQPLELGRGKPKLGRGSRVRARLPRPGTVHLLRTRLPQGRLQPSQLLAVGRELLELDLAGTIQSFAAPRGASNDATWIFASDLASLLDAPPYRMRAHTHRRRELEAGRRRGDELLELLREAPRAAGHLDCRASASRRRRRSAARGSSRSRSGAAARSRRARVDRQRCRSTSR